MKRPTIKKPDIKGSLQTRSFRVGGYSVAAAAIVLAIAVVVNVLVNALPTSVTQFDTSSNQLFTISEQTQQVLEGLTDDVTIYWVVQDGAEDDTLGLLLDRYAGLSKSVSVVKKDPDVYPTFVQQYVSGTFYNNSLIVESGQRSRFVSYEDIYEYEYDDNYWYTGEYSQSFAGESALTSAIRYVTNESLPRIYTLTGHGESTLATSFETAVEKENMELESLTLLTAGEVPEDADCVLIYAPQTDISSEELTMLQDYVQGGGSLFLVTAPLSDNSRLTNLEALMADYGVSAAEGVVIEGDGDHYALSAPYYLLPNIESHTITDPLSEGGYYVLLPIAQGLEVSDELPEDVSVTELLTTSSAAFSKLAGYNLTTYEREDGDLDGPFALAVAVTQTLDEGESHIVWVSSSGLLDESTNSRVSGGNQDLFLNALGWMCDHEDSITIHAKSMDREYLTISSSTAALLTLLVVAVIPLVYLGAGVCTWVRRKRR